MAYAVSFTPGALRQLRKLPRNVRERLVPAIDGLARNPRPIGSRKLTGDNLYRIRVGDYRIVYAIQDARLTVLVVTLGHRREVYRD